MDFIDFKKGLLANGIFKHRFVSAANGVIYASRIAYPHGIVYLDSYVDNKDIVMPSQAINEQGKTVDIVSIRNKVFFNNKDIERLVISRFVNEFTPSQFEGCLNLSAITIPAAIKKIPVNCFKGCIKLKDIYYEGDSQSFENIKFDDYTYKVVGKDVVYHGEGIYRHDNQGKEIIREYISDNECFRRARVHFNSCLDDFDWCLVNPYRDFYEWRSENKK